MANNPTLPGNESFPEGPPSPVPYTRVGQVQCLRMDGPFLVRGRNSVSHINDGWLCRGEDGYMFGVEDDAFASLFEIATYLVTPTAGANGAIDPSVPQFVAHGADQVFAVTANVLYELDELLVDGSPAVLTGSTYTFTNVTAPHSISATFKLIV